MIKSRSVNLIDMYVRKNIFVCLSQFVTGEFAKRDFSEKGSGDVVSAVCVQRDRWIVYKMSLTAQTACILKGVFTFFLTYTYM